MTTQTLDPIELFARLNPVPPERLDDLARGPERDQTFARVAARREERTSTGWAPRRRLVAAAIVSLAVALPSLAFSGAFGSLFRISNAGRPVHEGGLSTVTGFDISGAKERSVVQLAARHGVGVYGAKTAAGRLCYFVGPPDQSKVRSEGLGGGCMNAAASARFPSPTEPVVDMSLYVLAPGASGPSIQRLAGVAADGVASVQVLSLADCHVVASVPVIDNVYASDELPPTAEAVIVARDARGNAVWHLAVTPPNNPDATSCGLG